MGSITMPMTLVEKLGSDNKNTDVHSIIKTEQTTKTHK